MRTQVPHSICLRCAYFRGMHPDYLQGKPVPRCRAYPNANPVHDECGGGCDYFLPNDPLESEDPFGSWDIKRKYGYLFLDSAPMG